MNTKSDNAQALFNTNGSYHQADQSYNLHKTVQDGFAAASSGLIDIERVIISKLNSDASALSNISQYLLSLGGKRIRPILTLLSAALLGLEHKKHSGSRKFQQLIEAAAGIELIHMATLLHDDIIDKSPRRRHKESAYYKYGFIPTLLCGDFLLVRAFGLCAHLGEFVIRETESACVELTEGEVIEGKISPERQCSLDEYIDIISKKTASLFALSTAVGAHIAGADDANVTHMKNFGRYAGIAFQMIDDILDVVADENLLGKPSGTDLRQKTPSLVNLLWLESGCKTAAKFFATPDCSDLELDQALIHLRGSTLIEECRIYAKSFATKANSELMAIDSRLVNLETRGQLLGLIEFTLDRCL